MKNFVTTFGFLLLVIPSAKSACVVPTKALPFSAFTFRPSTLQIFTALNLTCSGFLTGWRVILTSPKPQNRVTGVYLAVFRQLTLSKFQLMGITEVNHVITPSSNSNISGDENYNGKNIKEHAEWQVIPARPQFPVQRGDVLGIFYKRWFIAEREVAIPVASEEHVPVGSPPTYVAVKDWYDVSETLQTGGVLSMSEAGVVRRLPALQAFINVGICGNSVVEDAEECDDSNTADNDGCSAFCRNEPISGLASAGVSADAWNPMNVCGNGNTEPPVEECDDGNRINGDGCSSKCLLEDPGGPTCGNGKKEPGEQCDDGNNHDGDGCSADCRREKAAVCGNQLLEIGEQCDDGNRENADGCNSRCMLEGLGICGDYNLDAGEECDDGNSENGDGCSSNCTKEVCGNGIRDVNEECDDGNDRDHDGCTAQCKSEKCGNGILEIGEQCDDGNQIGDDGCAANCTLEICGNGIREGLEQCDDGGTEGGDGCSAQCTFEVCGNKQLDPGEECDDGNTVSGDGCSSLCRVEVHAKFLAHARQSNRRPSVMSQQASDTIRVRIIERPIFSNILTTSSLPAPTSTTPTTTTTTQPAPLSTTTLQIAPPAAPMVDFSNYAEGETFALGSAAAAASVSEIVTIPTEPAKPANDATTTDRKTALRNLEGQMRILPPRQSLSLVASRLRAYPNYSAFTIRKSPIKRERFQPANNDDSIFQMSLPGHVNQHVLTFYEQRQQPRFRQQFLPARDEIMTTTTTTETATTTVKQIFTMDSQSVYPTISPKCLEAPLLGGVCRSSPLVRWFFNSLTNRCDWFYDKACYAGANYFESKPDCIAACGLLISDFSDKKK